MNPLLLWLLLGELALVAVVVGLWAMIAQRRKKARLFAALEKLLDNVADSESHHLLQLQLDLQTTFSITGPNVEKTAAALLANEREFLRSLMHTLLTGNPEGLESLHQALSRLTNRQIALVVEALPALRPERYAPDIGIPEIPDPEPARPGIGAEVEDRPMAVPAFEADWFASEASSQAAERGEPQISFPDEDEAPLAVAEARADAFTDAPENISEQDLMDGEPDGLLAEEVFESLPEEVEEPIADIPEEPEFADLGLEDLPLEEASEPLPVEIPEEDDAFPMEAEEPVADILEEREFMDLGLEDLPLEEASEPLPAEIPEEADAFPMEAEEPVADILEEREFTDFGLEEQPLEEASEPVPAEVLEEPSEPPLPENPPEAEASGADIAAPIEYAAEQEVAGGESGSSPPASPAEAKEPFAEILEQWVSTEERGIGDMEPEAQAAPERPLPVLSELLGLDELLSVAEETPAVDGLPETDAQVRESTPAESGSVTEPAPATPEMAADEGPAPPKRTRRAAPRKKKPEPETETPGDGA